MSTSPTPDRIRSRLIARVRAGRDLHYSRTPTLRDLAQEFRCTQAEILEVLENHPDVEIVAGARSGTGQAAFKQSDWRFEWVGEEEAQAA